MKILLFVGMMFVFVFAFTACGNDSAMPSLPGSVVEAPVVTEAPVDTNFNWSDLFDDEDNNDEFVFDFGEEDYNFAFNFGEDFDQGFILPSEEYPSEMLLEQGIPLEGTNPDLAGLTLATPDTVATFPEPVYINDEYELPPIDVLAEPVIEISFEEPEGLPQTNDPWSFVVVAIIFIVIAVMLYLVTSRHSYKSSN